MLFVAFLRIVGRTCWYFLGLRAFGLSKSLIPPDDKAPSFWPGGQIVTNAVASEEYRNLPATRLSKVREFVASDTSHSNIFKAEISSIRRWRFARELNKEPKDPGVDSDSDREFAYFSLAMKLRGIARSQRGFSEGHRGIFKGDNVLTDVLVGREPGADRLLLEIWRE